MTELDLRALADAWIANCLAPMAPSHTSDAIIGQIWQLCWDEPERAFQFVLEVLGRDHSDKILAVLSAGPLEEVLANHGERVETEARSNPLFATLLGGVWQDEMSDEVWRRVQAVWDRRGWDGVSGS